MNNKQLERLDNINKLIELIANTDRCFFRSSKGVSRFVALKTTVKYYDSYTGKQITINENNKDCNFSEGGTMWALVKDFKKYILTGKYTNGENGYGGLYCPYWGYTEDGQAKIIEFAKEIGYLKNTN